MTHDNVTDIEKRLLDVCVDWDGTQMNDAEEPRTWLTVGEIRMAAHTIEAQQADLATLRKQLENAREALAIRDKSTEPCPADKHHLGDKRCPKCGSSSVGPCWLKVSADSTFVDSAREALKGQPC